MSGRDNVFYFSFLFCFTEAPQPRAAFIRHIRCHRTPFILFASALLYNVDNMYKNPISMPRITTLLCLHLSQLLRAFQSTQKTFIGLTLSSF